MCVPSQKSPQSSHLVPLLCAFLAAAAQAADWPTDRHDVARSSVSTEQLAMPLSERWAYRPLHPPRPSWPTTQWNETKSVFDRTYHVAVAGDALFFGSSADGKVYALDTDTGSTRWTFFTGGPVRVAPTVWEGSVYVASDDGYAYCLSAQTGDVRWQLRAAPGDTKVLGHGSIISLWPIRTGVLVDKGVAYFAAGLFPSEGVYVYAVHASNGRVIWRNESAGARYVQHPHPGCDGFTGVPPQGPMVVSETRLFIPTGRGVPAVFDRADGRFLHWKQAESWKGVVRDGGAAISLVDNAIFTSPGNTALGAFTAAFEPDSWTKVIRSTDKQIISTPRAYYLLNRSGIRAVERGAFKEEMAMAVELDGLQSWYKKRTPEEDARMKELAERLKAQRRAPSSSKWQFRQKSLEAMILVGDTIFAAAGSTVIGVDARTGAKVWEAPVEGVACGLAVADGRLYVSTDKGTIHCFGGGPGEPSRRVEHAVVEEPFPHDVLADRYRAAARAIVKVSGITRGYCVVLSAGKGQLARELARDTELRIVCVEPDRKLAEAARTALDAAGLYGPRATVHTGTNECLPVPAYCANLIVCDDAIASGRLPQATPELVRILKPYGGTIVLGQSAGVPKAIDEAALRTWSLSSDEVTAEIIRKDGVWLKTVRGPLPGAGEWTHQFGSAAATACSEDQRARGPFELLWFGAPGPVKSVKGTISPLSTGGRIFVGVTPVQAYDAYNGLPLWEAPITDAAAMAATQDSVYVVRKGTSECIRLDAETGETRATLNVPADAQWGHLAVEGNQLFGTGLSTFKLDEQDRAVEQEFEELRIIKTYVRRVSGGASLHGSRHQLIKQMDALMAEVDKGFATKVPVDRLAKYKGRMLRLLARSSSRSLFALDRKTGAHQWTYTPTPGRYICHASIAIGDGRACFVEGRESEGDGTTKHLVALDASTGSKLWETERDLTTHCKPGPILHRPPHRVLVNSTECLSLAYRDDVLVLSETWGGQNLFAISAKDGKFLWSHRVPYNYYYRRRSMIVGDRVYTDRYAYDLHTGEAVMREHPITGERQPWVYNRAYGCGGSSASAQGLFFRSSVLSYFDLEDDQGITNFSAVRPGCWINVIPAAGLVLAPDQTRGCTCPYPIKASVALRPVERYRAWSFVTLAGTWEPVKHLALNLGAPGDRRDDKGTLWLGYPRPFHPRGFRFQLPCEYEEGMGFFRGSPDGAGTEGDIPWVHSSGCLGLRKITIPVDDSGTMQSVYTVRLYFAESATQASGERVFDVLIQGENRLPDLDIGRLAGRQGRGIVREVKGIKATDAVTIELVPRAKQPTKRNASLLNGIELIRVSFTDIAGKTPDVLTGKTIGKWMWTGPDPLVNDAKPGTYDATAHGAKATGSGGRATVHDGGTLGDPKGVKDDSFFTLGKIAELQGATSFAWTFEGLRLNRPGNHVLAGSIQNAFGPGSLFIITASAGDVPAGGRVAVTLWGQDSSGATKGRSSTTFGGMDLQLGKSSDAQIIFDSTRSVPANIGARVREHGNEEWGRIRWFSVPVVKLNPQYLGLPRSQPVYLGKYAAASTLASDFSVGTVSLKVPKQR